MKKPAILLTLLLFFAAALPRPASAANLRFSDVSQGDYFYEAVLWAAHTGVTTGTTETTFSPWDTCTRGQVVTFLWRANGSPEPVGRANPFRDVSPSAYYGKAVLWAVEQGITAGTTPTTFSPEDPCTYAHALTFLWRFEGEPFADGAGRNYTWYSDALIWARNTGLLPGIQFAPADLCPRANIVTSLYRTTQRGMPGFLSLSLQSASTPTDEDGEAGQTETADLRSYLRREALAGTEVISFDSEDFGSPSLESVLREVHALNCDPWLFLAQGTLCSYSGTEFQVYPKYNRDILDHYDEVVEYCTGELDAMVSQAEGGWSDLQKVLFANDYLAVHYDYDDTLTHDNIYDMLTDGVGTCVGYTGLMTVLLDRLGVPSTYVYSDSLEHMWNVVRVDDNWYHLDATWDDPSWTVSRSLGGPVHTWFLLSTGEMKSRGGGKHFARNDWTCGQDVDCSSTFYDHYFWKDAVSPFVKAENGWYYLDTQALKRWDGASNIATEVLPFSGVYRELYPQWNVSGSFVNLSGLFSLDGWLYLNTDSNLLRFNPATNQWQALLVLELSVPSGTGGSSTSPTSGATPAAPGKYCGHRRSRRWNLCGPMRP